MSMNQHQAQTHHFQRTQSIVFSSDDDNNEQTMRTRYSSPSTSTPSTTTASKEQVVDRDSQKKSPCGLYYPDYFPHTLNVYNQ